MWTLLLMTIGVPIDLLIKKQVEKKIDQNTILPYLGGRITLRNYQNRGAMLEVGRNRNRLVTGFSTMITAALLGIYIGLMIRGEGSARLRGALALIAGGGLCNTIDRLTKGYVVDYISFGKQKNGKRKVVYNLSDFAIFTGALLLALEELN